MKVKFLFPMKKINQSFGLTVTSCMKISFSWPQEGASDDSLICDQITDSCVYMNCAYLQAA